MQDRSVSYGVVLGAMFASRQQGEHAMDIPISFGMLMLLSRTFQEMPLRLLSRVDKVFTRRALKQRGTK